MICVPQCVPIAPQRCRKNPSFRQDLGGRLSAPQGRPQTLVNLGLNPGCPRRKGLLGRSRAAGRVADLVRRGKKTPPPRGPPLPLLPRTMVIGGSGQGPTGWFLGAPLPQPPRPGPLWSLMRPGQLRAHPGPQLWPSQYTRVQRAESSHGCREEPGALVQRG